MISWIPPEDEESYKHALSLLIQKFPVINDHIKTKYLNGERLDLGGHMAGKPGEVASTNGMERWGGLVKTEHSDVLGKLTDSKMESKNPYHLMVAAARAKKFHRSGTSHQVANKPDKFRNEYIHGYFIIINGSHFVPASSQNHRSRICKRINFNSTFLYSFAIIHKSDGSTSYVPLHEVFHSDTIWRKCSSITWVVPSSSVIYTELSEMLAQNNSSIFSAPIEMQRGPATSNLSPADLRDYNKLNAQLAELSPAKQQDLKQAIHERCLNDTALPQVGEDIFDYLQRRAHRDPAKDALDTSHRREVGSKSKQRGGSRKSSSKSKKSKSSMSLSERREELLREDKEEGNVHEEHVAGESEEVAGETDGKAANEDVVLDPDELISEVEYMARKPRVRVSKELGDFSRTHVGRNGEMKCTCGCFSFWRWCVHCVFMDVLHMKNYPSDERVTAATDQWHVIREKFLQVLEETHINMN